MGIYPSFKHGILKKVSREIKTFFTVEVKKDIVISSLFLLAYTLYWLYGKTNHALSDFSSLHISQATLDGISIPSRVGLFYKVVLSAFVLFPLIYGSLYRLANSFHLRETNLEVLSVIAASGLFLIIGDIIGMESKNGITFFLLLFISMAFLFGFKNHKGIGHLIGQASFYPAVLILSFLLYTALVFLFNANPIVTQHSIFWFYAIVFTVLLLIVFLKKNSGYFLRDLFRFSLPLALIPLYIFLSIELLFYCKIKFDVFIPYKWVFIGLLTVSFLVFVFLNFKRKKKPPSSKMFACFFVPSALLAFLLLTYYKANSRTTRGFI